MLFNSFSYALFLPLVFLLYWLPEAFGSHGRAGGKSTWQNAVLLAASYVFYGAWDWRFAILIAVTTASSWFSGILIEKNRNRASLICTANIILNLGILAFFKYAGFFVESFCTLFGIQADPGVTPLKIILPVGISFYTFQAIGYVIDVKRGKVAASHNALQFFAFISFFPQLVAGPIERASSLLPQFSAKRQFNYRQAFSGVGLILWGLFLKIVVADRLAVFVDAAWKNPQAANGLPALLAVIFFAFQLYTDFYSYSEIARGSARLFGMELMLNFRRPYLSQTFREFWKRWHISLSSWFGDYVYIPLGGNRRGTARMVLNTFIVFLLSGLWHGASWTFVAWGFLCAVFMFFPGNLLKKSAGIKVLNPLIVFSLWALSLILFRAATFNDALAMFSSLGFGNAAAIGNFGLGMQELFFAIGLIILLCVIEIVCERWGGSLANRFLASPALLRTAALVLLALIIIFLGRYGIGNDSRFIYFQF
ncbi:MAG: MBOAT family protein [Bacteroidales bacterium]|nr:MBOAT family protein [Bacteroidales bacterium]